MDYIFLHFYNKAHSTIKSLNMAVYSSFVMHIRMHINEKPFNLYNKIKMHILHRLLRWIYNNTRRIQTPCKKVYIFWWSVGLLTHLLPLPKVLHLTHIAVSGSSRQANENQIDLMQCCVFRPTNGDFQFKKL